MDTAPMGVGAYSDAYRATQPLSSMPSGPKLPRTPWA